MKKVFLYVSILAGCFILVGYGLFYGYEYFNRVDDGGNLSGNGQKPLASAMQAANPDDLGKRDSSGGDQAEPAEEPRISTKTKMIYEYYYTLDNVSETTEELAPYFLIDLTKDRLAEMFPGWDVVNFSSDEVVMRKYINERSIQHYIVGVKDGFVAVFYENAVNGGNLKEITDTPVKTLPETEQKRLEEGITIKGEEALMKALEDYGS